MENENDYVPCLISNMISITKRTLIHYPYISNCIFLANIAPNKDSTGHICNKQGPSLNLLLKIPQMTYSQTWSTSTVNSQQSAIKKSKFEIQLHYAMRNSYTPYVEFKVEKIWLCAT